MKSTYNKNLFLFESKPLVSEFDIRLLSSIEDTLHENGYILEKNIPLLLDWIIYKTRKNICFNQEDYITSSYEGRSNRAVTYINNLIKKLGINGFSFNIGDVLGTNKIHSITCINLPILNDLEIINKYFILDPTFRQFCLYEENRFERYYEEERWNLKLSTPHPGYFLNLYDNGKEFANNLIKYGYFDCSDINIKMYFDSFVLYATPKEYYESIDDLGKVYETPNDGNSYFNALLQCREEIGGSIRDFEFETPKETVLSMNKKILNKLKIRSNSF